MADATLGQIEIRNLSAFYGTFRAVNDVSMMIQPHAVTAIIGPSGCGKSTFLRVTEPDARARHPAPGSRVTCSWTA